MLKNIQIWKIDISFKTNLRDKIENIMSVHSDSMFISKKSHDYLNLIALFSSLQLVKLTEKLLNKESLGGSFWQVHLLDQKDWVKESHKHLPSIQIGIFAIHGDHIKMKSLRNTDIFINAGQAFGSGHHGSTLGAIYMISSLLKKKLCLKKY